MSSTTHPVEKHEAQLERHEKQLENHEARLQDLEQKFIAIQVQTKHYNEDIGAIKDMMHTFQDKLDKIMARDGQRWQQVVTTVITSITAALIGYILRGVIR